MAEKYKVLAGKWKKTGISGLEEFAAKNPSQTEGMDSDMVVVYKVNDKIEICWTIGSADPMNLCFVPDGVCEQDCQGYKFQATTSAIDGKISFEYAAEGAVLKKEVMSFPKENEMVAETTSNGATLTTTFVRDGTSL